MTSLSVRRSALLCGVSLFAVASAVSARAASPQTFSPNWFRARTTAATGSSPNTASASARATLRTMLNLQDMAARIRTQAAAQNAAAALAAARGSNGTGVPDGLVVGGLQPAPGATPSSIGTLWRGANLPTSSRAANGRVAVNVVQTDTLASLTWRSFNVGAQTDLSFIQKNAAGASQSGWTVLNRVEDPSANPSRILGSITAPGKVYVVNRNGVIFGAGAQVNVFSLIASTGAISENQYRTFGIYGTQSGSTYNPTFTGAPGNAGITVELGASIATVPPAGGGSDRPSVLLLGAQVVNDGSISAPSGQVVLASGRNFTLRQGYSTSGNALSTTLGTEVAVDGGGSVTNAGMITSDQGDVTLVGRFITQGGIAMASTSVFERGTVHLLTSTADSGAIITLTPNSVTTVVPDNSGQTAPDSTRQSLFAQAVGNTTTPTANLNDTDFLTDRRDLGRVEISTGGIIEFQSRSLTMVQGGQIKVQAGQRILLDHDAQLDVSGTTTATRSVTDNALAISLQKTPLRDSPVNRDSGLLANNTVYVDQRNEIVVPGTTGYGGNIYSGGGLVEVSGAANSVQHTVQEWTAVGGTISLVSTVVAVQSGATLNVAGGGVTYAPGLVRQSYLIGTDGKLYNVNSAPSTTDYLGVYNGITEDHPHWSVTRVYRDPLIGPSFLKEAGYVVGRDAGTVEVNAPTVLMSGAIAGGTLSGTEQTKARPAVVTDGYTLGQSVVAAGATFKIGDFGTLNPGGPTKFTTIVVGQDNGLANSVTITSHRDQIELNTATLDAGMLNAAGLGGLTLDTQASVTVASPLTLSAGGTLSIAASKIAIDADVTAHAGTIIASATTLTNPTTQQMQRYGHPAIALAPAVVLDVSGTWTNALLDPSNVAGLAEVNGGGVTLASAEGVTLGAASLIDASSGGAITQSGGTLGGVGGNVRVVGNTDATKFTLAPVLLLGTIEGYGVAGGGTLTLSTVSVRIADGGTADRGGVLLTPSFFESGFGTYNVNALTNVSVAAGTTVALVAPTYQFTADSLLVPTGVPVSAALLLGQQPLFTQDNLRATLQERPGVSLSLTAERGSGTNAVSGGSITVGRGAVITADPRQSVTFESFDQLTVDGRIVTHGGTVELLNSRFENSSVVRLNYQPGQSVWLGQDSTIDVSGLAFVAQDTLGRNYGTVIGGGRVLLGSVFAPTPYDPIDLPLVTDAAVIIRPGAVVNASGTAATIDRLAGNYALGLNALVPNQTSAPVLDATSGGTITISSANGAFIDGTLKATSGGAGAAGGTLALFTETPAFAAGTSGTVEVPDVLRHGHEIRVEQRATSILSASLRPGQIYDTRQIGTIAIGVDQISSGGFANVSLYARDAVLFDGNVSLHVPGSLSITTSYMSDTVSGGTVNASSSYLTLAGIEVYNASIAQFFSYAGLTHEIRTREPGSISFSANLIDIQQNVTIDGFSGVISLQNGSKRTERSYGFGEVSLASVGDIRFGNSAAQIALAGGVRAGDGIVTQNNLTLTAADIYPITNATATIASGGLLRDGKITIRSSGGAVELPYSVGGNLKINAAIIDQGGTVRAPEGILDLNASQLNNGNTYDSGAVTLEPGSITSISMAGQNIPYGGTPDGQNYTYAGNTPTLTAPAITVDAAFLDAKAGATIDIRGGGTLSGSGFTAGRGGSADTLTTPLPRFSKGSYTGGTYSTNPVYAIVPGYVGGYAPTAPADYGGDYAGTAPAVGETISIDNSIPGLAAGTYTLLPAYYALLPGAYRVQINATTPVTRGTALPQTDGSYVVAAQTGSSVTGSESSLPVSVTLSSGKVTRSYSSFDEQTYSGFVLGQAAIYNRPRNFIPEDAKDLYLNFVVPSRQISGLTYDATTLFAAAAPNDIGAFTSVYSSGSLEITARDAVPTRRYASISASELDKIGTPGLDLGGAVQFVLTGNTYGQIAANGQGDVAIIRPGAVVRAGMILVSARAGVTVDSGATLTTVGAGLPPIQASNGLYFGREAILLALSNGFIGYTGFATAGTPSPLQIDSGAVLVAGGSLVFSSQTSIIIGDQARFGARDITLSVSDINIGTAASLASFTVPSGLVLADTTLARLLAGDPSIGAPAAQGLTLTATQAVNFYGNAALSLGEGNGSELDFNTPAIYGAGTSGNTALISADTIVWNGVASSTTLGSGTGTSQAPGGVVRGGAGTGSGTLRLQARDIVLGYPAQSATINSTLSLDRLILGFATVELDASGQVTSNYKNTLSVYQNGPQVSGNPGTGGTLVIRTPVLTGDAGSSEIFTAGGAILVEAPASGARGTTSGAALGADISLDGSQVTIATAIALPAGSLSVTAAGDITIAAGGTIDASGRSVGFFDQTRSVMGGSVRLESTTGSITEAAGGTINVSGSRTSATSNAGNLQLTAAQGAVALNGAVLGGADASHTGGSIDVRAGTVESFNTLEATLVAGGFSALQSFAFGGGNGNVTITGSVVAHAVTLTADGGQLIVLGTIDAAGTAPGQIVLAGRDGLTLGSAALLDVHATQTQFDGYHQVITANNTGDVELTSSRGTVLLQSGAAIDEAAAVAGKLIINAPRINNADINVSASGHYALTNIGDVEVYGWETYGARRRSSVPSGGIVDATYLSDIDNGRGGLAGTKAFMAALSSSDIGARTSGLSGGGRTVHLRPGVEIDGTSDIAVTSDIDLSSFRYNGEPGALRLRAAGNLTINGSISDGFGAPKDSTSNPNPDDAGWQLYTAEPNGGDVRIPQNWGGKITLASGTTFGAVNESLNYDVVLQTSNILAYVVIPCAISLADTSSTYVFSSGWVATARITDANGRVLYNKGDVIKAGTTAEMGWQFGAGTVLPFAVDAGGPNGLLWKAGSNLDLFSSNVMLQNSVTLRGGAIIPYGSGTSLVFDNGATSEPLRGADRVGRQGEIYGNAPMLPAGSLSWSIDLVSGANLASADPLTVAPRSALNGGGNTVLADAHYADGNSNGYFTPTADFSVIRTGTGSLNIIAGGSFREYSSYGVYTAGTQVNVPASYNDPRGTSGDGTVLGASSPYADYVNTQGGYFTDGGGNVVVRAQGDVSGYTIAANPSTPGSGLPSISSEWVGDWLWRQGTGANDTAWSINFGNYVLPVYNNLQSPSNVVLTGFTGIGALGGGNLTVTAGGDAGVVRESTNASGLFTDSLDLAVAGSGRVSRGGVLTETGGGTLTVHVQGTLNPASLSTTGAGTFTDTRGAIDVTAGAIGTEVINFGAANGDPRGSGPYQIEGALAENGGITVVPGDAPVTVATRGELDLYGVGDPGRVQEQNAQDVTLDVGGQATVTPSARISSFSLWTDRTNITLTSAGGNVTPAGVISGGSSLMTDNASTTDGRYIYPSGLEVVAASGSINYGFNAGSSGSNSANVELAPSADGELEFLAAKSIVAGGAAFSISGADPTATEDTPFQPVFSVGASGTTVNGVPWVSYFALFAFGADTPTTALHAGDHNPVRFYAAGGDLVGVQTGEILNFGTNSVTPSVWYSAAKSVLMLAGNDIVGSGTAYNTAAVGNTQIYPNQNSSTAYGLPTVGSTGNLFLNVGPNDVSVVRAGRDILNSFFYIAGPGELSVEAGRNFYQGDTGLLRSLGPIVNVTSSNRNTGAGIAVTVGAGPAGPDYAAFEQDYLSPNNVADPSQPLNSPANAGKVVADYLPELTAYLQANYDPTITQANARAYFDTVLTQEQRDVFLRQIYYQELTLSGREYNDVTSRFYKTYDRGKNAVDVLFPGTAFGPPAATPYNGAVTFFSGTVSLAGTVTIDAGISTQFGGDIQLLVPGGNVVLGTTGGVSPSGNSGLLTFGSGNINVYSFGSVLLGQSRIFTTQGGSILVWSEAGDISAGVGSKTTVVNQPNSITYSNYGDITVSPSQPSSGAGIATLNLIEGVPPGDVDLVAPQGTIDAGEAGIRVSGNLNLAALTVVNAANVQVQGKATGVPTVAVANVGALTAASAAAGAAANQAQATGANQAAGRNAGSGSIITVEVLGFGG